MSVSLENVSFAYDKVAVLDDLTWHLPDEGVVCLWGVSRSSPFDPLQHSCLQLYLVSPAQGPSVLLSENKSLARMVRSYHPAMQGAGMNLEVSRINKIALNFFKHSFS